MGEHGRFEQIVSKFLLKSLHVILDSRVPSIHAQTRSRELVFGAQLNKCDKGFRLELGGRPSALENLNFWHRNLMEPMIIDVLLVQAISGSSGFGNVKETLIERWVVQYEHVKAVFPQYSESKAYKKSIILLRSLYTTMKLLPAYKVFRKLCSSSQSCDLDINYKVFSFTSPLAKEEENLMKQYNFSSVEAPNGRLSISVTYRENLSDFNIDTYASFPPQIITDYVGSPATDPFRAFPSSVKGVGSTTSHFKGANSPSSNPFQRPHTWTGGGIYHRSSSTPTDIYGRRVENSRLPAQHSPSLDEYQLSPPFSPSPSPSPPAYFSGGKSIHTLTRAETAPVSIPHAMMTRSPRYLSPNLSDSNRFSLPPLSPRSTRLNPSSQDSPSRKSDSSRGDFGHKGLRDSRDDSGRFSALLSSSGSPRVGVSRSSSSRLSFQDDLDECDFSCPFIVDDVDSSVSLSSHNLEGRRGSDNNPQASSSTVKKSQDAAVGALVLMLKHAPPLRQDSSCNSSHSSSKPEVVETEGGEASGLFITRKTSDALEELRSYKAMKDVLLSKSATKVFTEQEN